MKTIDCRLKVVDVLSHNFLMLLITYQKCGLKL